MTKSSWEQVAAVQAERVNQECFEAHRGAYLLCPPDLYVVFGNDGYAAGNWTKREVEIVRESIENDRRFSLLAFGLDDEQYTWACIVRCEDEDIDVDELNELVWNAFAVATDNDGDGGLQRTIADCALHVMTPVELE